jgi:predicted AAA+ superfamily ATPase
MASGTELIFYWSADKSKAEIDFIIQNGEEIIPIEVKAEENLKAKSLRVFYQKYGHSKPLRYSMSDYRKDDWLVNIPLYAAGTKP